VINCVKEWHIPFDIYLMANSRHRLPTTLILSIACLIAAIGCGKSNSAAQVKGRVICKDGPLPAAGVRMVRLEPTADSTAPIRKGASGSINDDGTFELYTRKPGDGVLPGKYAVTFAFYAGAMDHKSLIPAKYTKAATTPHQVTVENDIDDLELEIETTGVAQAAR
jgi:hypothetical protein